MTQQTPTHIPYKNWQALNLGFKLPILEESRENLRRHMHSNQVNFEALGKVVERDPALCLHMLHAAVEHKPECQEQVSCAASCLSMLGMKQLVSITKGLTIVPAHPDRRRLVLYRRALHCAQLASELAASWASSKGTINANQARWCSLLGDAPLWLWLLQHDRAQNCLHYLSDGQDLMPAGINTFGKQSFSHWYTLARQLHLPELVIQSYQPNLTTDEWYILRRADPRDSDTHKAHRALVLKCQQPDLLLTICRHLAWHLTVSPYSAKSRRWLNMASHWSGQSLTKTIAQVRKIQMNIAGRSQDKYHGGLHLFVSPVPCSHPYPYIADLSEQAEVSPATNVIPSEKIPEPAKHPASKKPASTINIAKLPKNNPVLPQPIKPSPLYLERLVKQLENDPDSFGDLHQLMQNLLKGIQQGIGLSCSGIALLNRNKTALKVIYNQGISEGDAMFNLLIDLNQNSLFNKMLEKTTSLQLTPEYLPRHASKVSKTVLGSLPEHCVIMSINAGASPIGVVIAYQQNAEVISKEDYLAFKNLCLTSCHSLSVLRRKTRKSTRTSGSMAKRPGA